LYFIAGKQTTEALLLQIAGRLCGIFKDDIPLRIHSNACVDIKKAYWNQEELFERARKAVGELYKDTIPEIPLSKNKFTKRQLGKNCRKNLTKVEDDRLDGGWDRKAECKMANIYISDFGEGRRNSKHCELPTEEEVSHIRKKIVKQLKNNEERLGMKYVKRSYYKPSGNKDYVKKLINIWKDGTTGWLTDREIKKIVGEKCNLSNYTRWDLGKSKKYKILDVSLQNVSGSKYKLRTFVLDIINNKNEEDDEE
jgi:hypothetical protein